jgi:hypothetical protein
MMIVPADVPGLESLCWNRSKAAPIDREAVFGLQGSDNSKV